MNRIIEEDLIHTYQGLTNKEKEKLKNSKVLLIGAGGFLGQYYLRFFNYYFKELSLRKIVALDNFILGESPLIKQNRNNENVVIKTFDIAKDDLSLIDDLVKDVDYVFHLASIASPIIYRKNPIETFDSNVSGLRNVLEYYKNKSVKGILYYSSSEAYGNPDVEHIPTKEDYHGYVNTIGPRSCYDESKRASETLAYLFNQQYRLPVRIVRLFNIYGPGLKLNDYRVISDFARNIKKKEDIEILSNGLPTRSFCYISDSAIGEIKSLLYDKFDVFNIGIDEKEVSINDLADTMLFIAKRDFGYEGKIVYGVSKDANYLKDNPDRRFPNLDKTKKVLNYCPTIMLEDGIKRYLTYVLESDINDLIW